MAGAEPGELFGHTLWEVWPASVTTEIERRYKQAMLTGEAQSFVHHYFGEGRDRWLEILVYPGEAGLALYVRDISESKRQSAKLARHERVYKAALGNTLDNVFVFDLSHRLIYANEPVLALWGLTWDQAIGKTCLELGYPEWRARWRDREIDQVIKTKLPVRGEGPYDSIHGSMFFEHILAPVIGPNGEVEAVATTSRDITQRYKTEQLLRASEERLRLAQSAGGLATWDCNLETGETIWSSGSHRVYGCLPQEMPTVEQFNAVVHPDDREAIMQAIQRTIDSGAEYHQEFRITWPDGSIHWLDGHAAVNYSPDGRAVRMVGINSDITERKQAEAAQQSQRKHLIELFEQAPAFMALLRGPDHVFEFVNPLYRELIGHRDVICKPFREVFDEAREQGSIDRFDRAYTTGIPVTTHAQPIDLVRTPGQPPERRYLDQVIQPMREPDGTVSGVILLGVDVTEAKKTEEALLQSEKLAAVGRLAASISHEINNPLAAVTNLLYLIRGDTTLSSDTRVYLELAESELERVSHITTQTLRFFRQSTNPVPVEIKSILDSVAVLYQRRLANAEVVLERKCSTPDPILVHDGELRQIVANLVGNSLDAVGCKGRIALRERRATDWRTGRKGVLVTVADTGRGMSREVMQRIFDPFFTTKGDIGTGLGLWVSREMVKKRGGAIHVRSSQTEPHRGTVFSVFLPDVESPPIEPIAPER
jgi:PAS domain S-box-containing protein